MGRFHDRMEDELRNRGYSANTRECYLRCVRNFVHHFMRPPDQLTPEHIRDYQLYLTRDRHVFWPYFNQVVCALRFFYRQAEGIALLEHALSAIESMGFGALPRFLLDLGEAYVLAARLEDALEVAGRALSLTRERGQRPYEAWALRLLGEVAARRDPPEHADGHYRDALVLAKELGMRPLAVHCYLGLGKLYRRTGKRQEAQEYLATATTLYREMDMTLLAGAVGGGAEGVSVRPMGLGHNSACSSPRPGEEALLH